MPYSPQAAAHKAQFVQFVYNMYSANSSSLTPPVDSGLAAAGYAFLFYLTAHDIKEVKFYGYLAAPTNSPGDVLLAIRGTEDTKEWLLDFDALPLPYLGKGAVAAGFRSIADTFNFIDATGGNHGNLTTMLAARNAASPISSITILGHSLGSALATLAAAQIAFSTLGLATLVELWTYASPRVGLPDFEGAFNKALPNTYRIFNSLDIVPQVPTFPYVHVGQSKELKQTQEQIQQLQTTPACEHHLSTYEWLLDPGEFSIESDCRVAAPAAGQAEAMAAHAMGAAAATVNERALGAAALARELHRPK
jgi:hypothetical protein